MAEIPGDGFAGVGAQTEFLVRKGEPGVGTKMIPGLGGNCRTVWGGRAQDCTGALTPFRSEKPDHDTGLPSVWLHPPIPPGHSA